MTPIQQFESIVLGTITEFLTEFQTHPVHSYSIPDMISPVLSATQDAKCDRDSITAELCHTLMKYYKHYLSLVARYKLLTILFPVCRTFVDTVYYSVHECKACGNSGWWCRGCGGSFKLDAMEEAGIENADEIRDYQFAGCEEPMVPCFLCNKSGTKPNNEDGYEVDAEFWNTSEF